jgi:uncharacterized alpha-E superfamily protein/transglutaminase-like putative cysteine protease
MLLARTAQAVYWAGRYLERAENMSRLVFVHTDSHMDLPVGQDVGWAPLLAVVGADRSWLGPMSEVDVIDYLLVDPGNASSVLAALTTARDDLRLARAVVPREAWEMCNELCRRQRETRQLVRTRQGRVGWLRQVMSTCQRLNGSLLGSMRRDEALAFARIAQHLERSDMTSRVMQARAESALPSQPDDTYAEVRAMAVLRALDAYQPFRRSIRSRQDPTALLSFVLEDEAFPRSLACCLAELRQQLKELPRNEAPMAACEEASIKLSDTNLRSMTSTDLRRLMGEFINALANIDGALSATYFESDVPAPFIETALRRPSSADPPRVGRHLDMKADDAHTFQVVHRTVYRYSDVAERSYNETHLRPRSTVHQECVAHRLDVDPTPESSAEYLDSFGNSVRTFTVAGSFEVLEVTATSEVVLWQPPAPPILSPWESTRTVLERDRRPESVDARQYRAPSRLVRIEPALLEYASLSFTPRRPVLEAILDLCGRIHADFNYEPGTTSVTTPVLEVLNERRGVCQDFAHVFIGCLRSVGLAARYVSGYIESAPPGSSANVGGDASHAWASAFLPGWGWLEVDPTNNQLVSSSHVTAAWGRDYWDVSPIRGSVEGGGDSHTLEVQVEVRRL